MNPDRKERIVISTAERIGAEKMLLLLIRDFQADGEFLDAEKIRIRGKQILAVEIDDGDVFPRAAECVGNGEDVTVKIRRGKQ